MKKLFKILIYIIIILFVLSAVGGFLAAKFIDPNRYKDKIITAVHDKTGRDLTIGGDIELSFFPWLGARIHDVRLSNAPGFEPQDRFVSVGEADISVKLLPLLSHQVEVGKITLRDVDLNLAKNKVGLTNWQDLTTRPAIQATVPTTVKPTTAANNPAAAAFAVSVAGIDIENANISWIDEQKGQNIQLKNLNATSKNPQSDKTFPFSITFDVNSSKPALTGHFSFKSDVLAAGNTYQLIHPRLSFAAQKEAQAFTFQADQVAVDKHQQTLSVTNAAITGGDLDAKIKSLNAQQIFSNPSFSGDLQVAPFNLKNVLKALGKNIATQDPNALQQVALTTQFSGAIRSLKLSHFTLKLDGSTVQGNLNVADFSKPMADFNVTIDQLNLDRYMPPKSSATAAAPATPASATSAAASAQSPSAMRKANINGALRIGTLTVAQTVLTQVSAQIALANGVLKVDPLNANVYQGSARGKVAINFQGAAPVYSIDETLSNIDMTQLVKSGKLTGRANLTTHLTMQGNDKNAILRSLNGTTQFDLQNGALVGKDIPYEVERAVALFKKQAPPPAPAKNQTDFDVFKGTGTFTNGVFSNHDLLVQSTKFKATGSGTANLVTEALDYHLVMVGLHTTTDAQGNTAQEERQTQLPVAITGTLSDPVVKPDLAALLKSEVGQKAVNKISDKLEERLPGSGRAIGGALRQLLNR